MGRKREAYSEAFETFWSTYPEREGHNSKKGTHRCWQTTLKENSPGTLIEAARGYRDYCQRGRNIGTRFVMQGTRFLGRDEPWRDYLPKKKPRVAASPVSAKSEGIPDESRVDGRPFLREIIEKLSHKVAVR